MTSFASYFAFVVLLLIAIPVRKPFVKQLLMLAASYMFYATWGIGFLAVLIASSLLNFGLGEFLRRRPVAGRLRIGIVANVVLLSSFKYLPPLASGNDFFRQIVMPVGMSFWTFQALSYLFDIYREEEVDPSIWEFCLYMAFWPTVLSGPVCRLPNLLPQFRQAQSVSSSDRAVAVSRIGTGLFMKLILAQLLASGLSEGGGTTAGFDEVGRQWGGLDVWFLAIGFGFQLFFDFAGYSHIVIGAARLFGFHLEENFDSPYLSSTPSAFWTRWHMSLSSWIRDYVFVPLATMRREVWWRYAALLSSMVIFGLWHGAKATLILWGAYHGVVLVLHRIVQQLGRHFDINVQGTWNSLLSWAVTFPAISLGWIFFRANDLPQALIMFQSALSPYSYQRMILPRDYYVLVLVSVAGYFAYSGLAHIGYLTNHNGYVRTASWPGSRGAVGEFLQFYWENRWWWLTPMLVTLLILGLIVSWPSSGIFPFIYTLF